MTKVLLIIPAYNEEENIVKVVETVRNYADSLSEEDFSLDYVVINDGSTDKTASLCRENHINVVNLIMNLGIGGAVQTGYQYALREGYDVAVQFDGDGQHDIRSLKDLLEPILSGEADFTVGSRFVTRDAENFQSTAARRLGINFLSFLLKLYAGIRVRDCTSGYRAANHKVIKLFSEDYPVDYPEPESLVHIHKNGFSIKEVPAKMLEREGGKSSIRAFKSVYYMIKVSLAITVAGFQRRK